MTIINADRKPVSISVKFIVLSTLLLAVALVKPVNGEDSSSSSVLMSDADLFIKCDMADLRQTSIVQELEMLKEEGDGFSGDTIKIGNSDQVAQLGKELQEMTGLEEDDFLSFAVAADLKDIDWEAPEDQRNINMAGAIELAKPLSLDDLEKALKKTAEMREEDTPAPGFSRQTIAGQEVLKVYEKESAESTEEGDNQIDRLYFASVEGEKTLLAGTLKGISKALERLSDDAVEDVESGFPAWMVENITDEHLAVLFKLTPEIRSKLSDAIEEMDAGKEKSQNSGGNTSHKDAFLEVLPDMETIKLSMVFSDVIDCRLESGLDNASSASQLQQLLQNPVISMTQVTLMFITEGKNLPFSRSLRAGVEDDVRTSLSFQISMEDVEMLRKASAKKADEAPLVPNQEGDGGGEEE